MCYPPANGNFFHFFAHNTRPWWQWARHEHQPTNQPHTYTYIYILFVEHTGKRSAWRFNLSDQPYGIADIDFKVQFNFPRHSRNFMVSVNGGLTKSYIHTYIYTNMHSLKHLMFFDISILFCMCICLCVCMFCLPRVKRVTCEFIKFCLDFSWIRFGCCYLSPQ